MLRNRPVLNLSLLALASCSSAVYAQQKPLQVLIDRAQLLDAQGRHDLAAEHWRQVLLLDPKQPAGLAAMAAYYMAAGDQAKASYFERLLSQVQPSGTVAPGTSPVATTLRSNDTRLDQVSRLNVQRQYAAALEILRQVFGPTPPDNWGVTYYQTEAALPSERAHGIAGLRALAAKYPANPGYQLALGKVLTYGPETRPEGMRLLADFRGTASQNEEARSAWKDAILWDPESPAALASSKQYLERYPNEELGNRPGAAALKIKAVAGPSAAEQAGYRALADGDLSEAESNFTSMTADRSQAARGEAGLGYVNMRRKDFPGAVSHFEKARARVMRSAELDKALHESRYWAMMSKGNQDLLASNPEQAAAEFTRARQTDPKRPEAAEALGGSLLAQQDPQQAEDIFATDVKNNPGRPDAWLGWMNALLESGKMDRVLAIQQNIPASVRAQLLHRADYLAMLLVATRAQGSDADSRMILARLVKTDAAEGPAGAAGSGNPDNGDARAAAILFRYSYFDDASRLCVSALKRDSRNAEIWQILAQSEHMAGRDRNAIAIATRMPRSVDAEAMGNAGFLLALATAYQGDAQFSKAQALLDQAQTLTSTTDQRGLTALQMQQASLSTAEGKSDVAYRQYQEIARTSPDELDAWTGMFSALHSGKHDDQALAEMHDVPENVSSKLRHDAAFLQTAGFIYSATGHHREALLCLRAVIDHYEQQHQPVPFGAAVGIAWLQLNAGNERDLAVSLDRLGRQRNLSVSQTLEVGKVWAAWSMRRAETFYTSGDSRQAVSVLQTAVRAYPGDLTLKTALAGMYVRTGNPDEGMKLYRSMNWNTATVDQFTAGIGAALTAHSMSYADYWLHLGLEMYPDNPALLRAGAHVEESKGNLKAAENYLKLAVGHQSPQESAAATAVEAPTLPPVADAESDAADISPADELARVLTGVKTATPAKADAPEPASSSPVTGIRDTEGLYTPQALDASAPPASVQQVAFHAEQGVEAASARPARKTAKRATPEEDEFGSGKTEKAGSGRDGQSSERSSEITADPLRGLDLGLSDSGGRASSTADQGFRQQSSGLSHGSLSALLDSTEAQSVRGGSDEAVNSDSANGDSVAGSSPAGTSLEGQLLGAEPEQALSLQASNGGLSNPAGGISHLNAKNVTSPPASAADELATLQAEYSPLLIGGGQAESHSGTLGFDRLQVFEADFAASRVLGLGAARLSVITRPVLLQSGIPDATSNYRFGSGSVLPTDAQYASGTGATLQLADRDLEASIGFSPSGFPVTNILGGVSVRPLHGPITLSAYRSSERDSLLSYAGMKDPVTGLAWGGVVASGGSIQVAHGAASSGFYGSLDGQRLTGERVLDNSRIMGNAGAYWLAFSNPYGDLKIGANLTAMHYAMNQRYFTVGQGGYFSPNAFLLMNAPVTWEGRPIHNTSYTIGGSLGVQSIQEGAALAGSLITGTGVETTNGASYDLHGRVAHRMDAHWTLEGFFATNNARDYTDKSGGFTVRYSMNPLPPEFAPTGFINLAEPLPIQAP